MRNIKRQRWALLALVIFGTAMPATAETSIFELSVTNESSADLTFILHDGKSKHTNLTYNKKVVSSHKIKAGTSDTVGIKPTGKKCTTNCGACNPSIGKVYAYYKDSKGELVRNNYYKATLEFFEYCGVSGSKPITTYTTNWTFDHGGGKGTNFYDHDQSSSHNSYTSSSPAKGLTFEASKVSGHATITYSDP